MDGISYVFEVSDQLDELMAGKRWYEQDGSCWHRIKEDGKWRWQPLNWQAFGKGEPTSEMSDTFIPEGAFGHAAKDHPQ